MKNPCMSIKNGNFIFFISLISAPVCTSCLVLIMFTFSISFNAYTFLSLLSLKSDLFIYHNFTCSFIFFRLSSIVYLIYTYEYINIIQDERYMKRTSSNLRNQLFYPLRPNWTTFQIVLRRHF